MLKRILGILLVAIMVFQGLTLSVFAEESHKGMIGDNLNWELNADGVLTISGVGDMKDFDRSVPPWMSWGLKTSKVVIENGVTSVGNRAFSNCTDLKEVVLSSSITDIGEYAFSKCSALKSITIPSGVTVIRKCAFKDAASLSSIEIPNGVTAIEDYTFWGCCKLRNVVLPDSLTRIASNAFLGCALLEKIQIPKNVSFIGDGAFGMCPSLKELTVDSENTRFCVENGCLFDIGRYVLHRAPATASGVFVIPDGVRMIESYAFSGTNISSVVIPDSVYFLGAYAFKNCRKLRSVYIPSSIITMGVEAFKNCTSLSAVTFEPASEENAQREDSALKHISLLSFSDCAVLTDVVIPGNITEITDYAFYNCSNIKNVYYYGTEAEYKNISIGDYNNNFIAAEVHFIDSKKENVIHFDGAGGKTSEIIQVGENGSTYRLLPTAVWNKHKFEGWYSDVSGGEQITKTSVVDLSSTQALYAHWSEGADEYTIKFEPGVGHVDTTSKTVSNGDVYGELPIPKREGYTFDGWHTRPGLYTFGEDVYITQEVGEKISEDTIVALNDDQTLYAHWTPNAILPELTDFTYSFENSRAGFGYDEHYKISREKYELIFGKNHAGEKRYYGNFGKGWVGNCYGISCTTCMMYQDNNDIDVKDFNIAANVPLQLNLQDVDSKINLTLIDFIEAMQISQNSPIIADIKEKNLNDIQALCDQVRYFQTTGQNPVIVSIKPDAHLGHAMVAYRLDESSGTEDRLYVYDSNHPKEVNCYILLDKDNTGKYTGEWYYEPLGWGSLKYIENQSPRISFYPYEYFYRIWENRGKDTNSVEASNAFEVESVKANNMEALTINKTEASVFDGNNDLVAVVRDGALRSYKENIYCMHDDGIAIDGAANKDSVTIWMPVGEYTVVNDGDSSGNFEILMSQNEQVADVVTGANKVTLRVNDSELLNFVQICDKEKKFSVNLTSAIPGAKSDVLVSGITKDDAFTVMQYAGEVKLGGSGSDLKATVDGVSVSPDSLMGEIPTFRSTDPENSANSASLFEDVSSDAYYYDAVAWAYKNNVTTGESETLFAPYDGCTRGQAVTFLWRAMGQPEPQTKNNPFRDVKPYDYYYKAVQWAVENGITSGTSETEFSPEEECSYAHILTFVYRTLGEPEKTGTGEWWSDAFRWAKNNTLFGDAKIKYTSGQICPRCDIVTVLYHAQGNNK